MDRTTVPALTAGNKRQWQSKIKPFLRVKDLWSTVEEPGEEETAKAKEAWWLQDGKAMSWMSLTTDDSIINLFEDALTANQWWKMVEEKLGGKSTLELMALGSELEELRQGETETVVSLASRVKGYSSELRAAGRCSASRRS
jgi:hypothetical protein